MKQIFIFALILICYNSQLVSSKPSDHDDLFADSVEKIEPVTLRTNKVATRPRTSAPVVDERGNSEVLSDNPGLPIEY